MDKNIVVKKTAPESAEIIKRAESKDSMKIMLSSDWHYDSTCCDRDMLTDHLKQAEKENAIVCVFGDLVDCMQGKYDPRRDPEELKKKYKVRSYFDAVVIDTGEFLSKFNVQYILCDGNHEEDVIEHNGTDMLERITWHLRYEHKMKVIHMGYSGYIYLGFDYRRGMARASKLLYFHHGVSSYAKVTRGVIWTNRQGRWLTDPDYVVNGHNHFAYSMPLSTERFNPRTRRTVRGSQHYFRSPGYKNSPTDTHRMTGWAAQKQRDPANKGCYILDLHYSHNGDTITKEIIDRTQ